MYASIIAALDGSEQSLLALEHALAIAECFRSKLILVHASPHTSGLRDSIEYNNIVALRTKEGQATAHIVSEGGVGTISDSGLCYGKNESKPGDRNTHRRYLLFGYAGEQQNIIT